MATPRRHRSGKLVRLRVAKLRGAKIGKNNGEEAEVLAGLEIGDEVVMHPSDKIADGKIIAARKPD